MAKEYPEWQAKAILAIDPNADYSSRVDFTNGTLTDFEWKSTPITIEDINTKADELKAAQEYKDERVEKYKELGMWQDQLDMIYHDFDNWKAKIKEIKDAHPKP